MSREAMCTQDSETAQSCQLVRASLRTISQRGIPTQILDGNAERRGLHLTRAEIDALYVQI